MAPFGLLNRAEVEVLTAEGVEDRSCIQVIEYVADILSACVDVLVVFE